MIKLFLGNKTVVLLLLPLYILLYQLLNYFFGFYEFDQLPNFGFWTPYFQLHSVLSAFLASVFVLLNAFGLNSLVNKNNFHERNTYLVALVYIVFMSLFQSSYMLSGILICQSGIILMTHHLFMLLKHEDGRKDIFNAFFFLGIGVTLSPVLLLTVPILLISVMLIRPFFLKELFSAFIGLTIPFIYLFSLEYLMNQQLNFDFVSQQLEFENKDFLFVSISLTLFLILASVGAYLKSKNAKIQTNKQIRILIILIVTFIFCSLYQIVSFQQIDHLSLILIPLSI